MGYKVIPQPYTVIWDYSDWTRSKTQLGDTSLADWCSENCTGQVNIFQPQGVDGKMISFSPGQEPSDDHHRYIIICMFEQPRDALLFKLTWVV